MKPPSKTVVQTTTNEMYLPVRLVYNVKNAAKLHQRFDDHPAMDWDPEEKRWVWFYERKLHTRGFPKSYKKAAANSGYIVLASCRMPRKDTLHVFTRCHFRAARFLAFFDKTVPRSVAKGEFLDTYNRIITLSSTGETQVPEHYFKNEKKIEFFDTLALLDGAKTKAETQAVMALIMARQETETLAELQRTRLELFYADGVKAFEEALRVRELMVMFQHNSGKPVCPYKFIRDIIAPDPGKPA